MPTKTPEEKLASAQDNGLVEKPTDVPKTGAAALAPAGGFSSASKKFKEHLHSEYNKHVKALQAAFSAKYPNPSYNEPEIDAEYGFKAYVGHPDDPTNPGPYVDPVPFLNWAKTVVPSFGENPPPEPHKDAVDLESSLRYQVWSNPEEAKSDVRSDLIKEKGMTKEQADEFINQHLDFVSPVSFGVLGDPDDKDIVHDESSIKVKAKHNDEPAWLQEWKAKAKPEDYTSDDEPDDPWGEPDDDGAFSSSSMTPGYTGPGADTGITTPITATPAHAALAERVQRQARLMQRFYDTDAAGKKFHAEYDARRQNDPEFWKHEPGMAAKMTKEMHGLAGRLAKGKMTWEDVYRAYKHSPHQPASLFGKYLVWRTHNVEKYDTPQTAAALDRDFLKHHTIGQASKKNGHVTPYDLETWAHRNGHILGQMLTYKDMQNARILRGVGLNVRTIHGEPYIALTRSLDSDIMNREHKLSSWADDPNVSFGSVRHHAWVPLNDLWYSYDMGPRYPGGNFGPEDEYLLSDSLPRYEADEKGHDTKPNRFRRWSEKTESYTDEGRKRREATMYDDVTDEQLAQAFKGEVERDPAYWSSQTPESTSQWEAYANHRNAGPLTWKTISDHFLSTTPEYYAENPTAKHDAFEGMYRSPSAPVDELMQELQANPNSGLLAHGLARNKNLKPEHLDYFISSNPMKARNFLSSSVPYKNLNSSHMDRIADLMIEMDRAGTDHTFFRDYAQKLLSNPLTSRETAIKVLNHGAEANPVAVYKNHEAVGSNPNLRDEDVTRAYVKVIAAAIRLRASGGTFGAEAKFPRDVAEHAFDVAKEYDEATSAGERDTSADVKAPSVELRREAEMSLEVMKAYVAGHHADPALATKMIQQWPDVLPSHVAYAMENGRKVPAEVQSAVVSALITRAQEKGYSAASAKDQLQNIASSKHLAPEAIELILHNGKVLGPTVEYLGLNKSPEVREAMRSILERQGISIPESTIEHLTDEDAGLGLLDFAPHLDGVAKKVWNKVAYHVASHHAYERRRAREHVIKRWPEGLAKSDPWFTSRMHQWLSGVNKKTTGQNGYHYATHFRDAMNILHDGVIRPQATDRVLDGYAVFAHHASDDPKHVEKLLRLGAKENDVPVVLHFETDEEPTGMHAGQPYWGNEVNVRNAHVAHKGTETMAKSLSKMALTDIAPGKLVDTIRPHSGKPDPRGSSFEPEVGTRIYDYDHVLSPMQKQGLKGLTVRVEHRAPAGIAAPVLRAKLIHNGENVGRVIASVQPSNTGRKGIRIGLSEIDDALDTNGKPLYMGKRLGQALYNAVLAHAKNVLGVEVAHGSDHSSLAHAAWKRLAAQHGLKYEAESNLPGPIAAKHKAAPFDDAYGPYEVQLKSEGALNLLNRKPLEDWEVDTAHAMLGHHPHAQRALQAAQWLSGRKTEANDDVYRMALRIHDGDHERAALHAYGLTDSEHNLKALRGLMESKSFAKSEDEAPLIHSVEAAFSDGQETADEVKRAVQSGSVQELKLSGKHSKGSMAAKDPETENVWLLKPGSGSQSPAAGSRDITQSQSRREAAFWHIAEKYGMGGFYPHCDLLMVNGQEWAAMSLLASSFDNLDKKARKNPDYAVNVLEPYRRTGIIHRWAVLDWILGNPDRHGQNLMVDRDGNVALIDHGSAFAGDNFDPAHDAKSFIPFYLRVWGPKDFFELSPEDRMHFMPEVDHETEKALKAWLDSITPEGLAQELSTYGIDPGPELRRLQMLKDPSPHRLCERINALWAGYEFDED